ncbi:GNAT family N-acetyltransferase [Paenibacillus radicis (ex Xue et al. 2023)]|uniref:GNAT family N-acetyltransferase n=1 Tax=Paenibacillus radicis (ex Xue et al. 2023) TaxID=2972489 RepID=A0ABT1YF22_9BACL|nr:GNAT family N-acetyltransferase [Paenibacillus radicis (ex Xue et al. 2023)]MCR8631803.1 GNAT family N-acetyltransferase [Paenibacillus radicis (ex Xue et al. 2023)]
MSEYLYSKELYVFELDQPVKARVRSYTREDFPDLISIQQQSFPPPFPSELWWNEEQLNNHITLFPEGALCVEIAGKPVASITGLLVNFDPGHTDHTWEEITDSGYIRNHNPAGDTLYIVDICAIPAYRKLGLGKLLMQSMYEVVIALNLKRLLGGGRIPGFSKYAVTMTAEQYTAAVVGGSLKDPVLTFLLRCGRMPVKLVRGYLDDEESLNYAMLMEWRNPFYK